MQLMSCCFSIGAEHPFDVARERQTVRFRSVIRDPKMGNLHCVVARTSDLNALPSRVLHRLGSSNPHTEVITEIDERLSIDTVSDVLRTWQGDPDRQRQFFAGVCEALLDLLTIYGRTVGTFFRSTRERQEWRATFEVFVGGLTTTLAIASREPSVVA